MRMKHPHVSMDELVSLAKRRGFVYPGSSIYGGLANSWDFGPLGVELKNNIKRLWWEFFVRRRSDMYGLDAAIIMNRKVWQASGHEEGFSDPLVECKKCHERFRVDHLNFMNGGGRITTSQEESERFQKLFLVDPVSAIRQYPEAAADRYWKCPSCKEGNDLPTTLPKNFNLMFKTHLGPVDDGENEVYLRPETAQGIFVNFRNIVDSMSPKIPFGIAQTGKAFRNEITPGNFIFRTREFEQMEIEYFIKKDEWETQFSHWEEELKAWMEYIGLDTERVHNNNIPADELAHYSKKTIDIEFEFPFGKKELYGLAYRTDFDLKAHQEASGDSMEYTDPHTKEKFIPHVIEPSLGVERTFLALLISAYRKDGDRVYLAFKPRIAPFIAAVFPLLANKPQLVEKAREVFEMLKKSGVGAVAWDERGNIGKRYYAQDEVGTPFCITVDFDTLENDMVTVRNRDDATQERKSIQDLVSFLDAQKGA